MKYLLAISVMAMLLLFGCVSQGENANASNANQQAVQQQGGDVKNQGAGVQPGISNLLDLAKSGMMYHCKLMEKSTNLEKVELWFYYDPNTKESKINTRVTDSGKIFQTITLSKQLDKVLETTIYMENPDSSQGCKWLTMTSKTEAPETDYSKMTLDDYAKAQEIQNVEDLDYVYNCDTRVYSASLFVPEGNSCDLSKMMGGLPS